MKKFLIFLITSFFLSSYSTIFSQTNLYWNGIIKDDFLVNDDSVGATSQISPNISTNNSNQAIICWADWRSGYGDIYIQRFDSTGLPIGSNAFLVSFPYQTPKILLFDNGNFIIFCQKNSKLFWQYFNSSSQPLINMTPISDSLSVEQGRCRMAKDRNGNFAAVWMDNRGGFYDIHLQYFDSTASPQGDVIKVNQTSHIYNQYPDIAFFENKDFVVVWQSEDSVSQDSYLWFQLFSHSGNPLGGNHIINISTLYPQSTPAVEINQNDEFMVVWSNSDGELFAQSFNQIGQPLCPIITIGNLNSVRYEPEIVNLPDSNFLIGWKQFNSQDWGNIIMQKITVSGTLLGTTIKVNDDSTSQEQSYLSIGDVVKKYVFFVWQDERDIEVNIYSQKFDLNLQTLGFNQKVNDDYGTATQSSPAVDVNEAGNIVITWQDGRDISTGPDIYAQYLDSLGNCIGQNFKVNDDNLQEQGQIFADVTIGDNGNFACVWIDKRYGTYGDIEQDIYGQWYDSMGNLMGNNRRINQPLLFASEYFPRIDMNASGVSATTWFTISHSYAKIFNSSGWAISGDILLEEINNSTSYPDVAICDDGRFMAVWCDTRNGNSDIYFQRFSGSGYNLGTNVRINDDLGNARQYAPSFDINNFGMGIATWVDERNGSQEVWAQRLDIDGNILGNNFKVQNVNAIGIPYKPRVAINKLGKSIVVWHFALPDYNYAIYAQKYDEAGAEIGENFLVVDTMQIFKSISPQVACNNKKVVIVWEDNRRKKGFDIYAKIIDWEWEGINYLESTDIVFPTAFITFPNFPNPFNNITTINYVLRNSTKVELCIFNILGQKVRILVSGQINAGKQRIKWDGKDDSGREVASGLYIYQLVAGKHRESRKMLLLR